MEPMELKINLAALSNIEHPTSNIQHPTSNIQHRTSSGEGELKGPLV